MFTSHGRRHAQAQRDRVRQGRCAQSTCSLLPATTARAIKDSVRTAHRAWRVRRLAEGQCLKRSAPRGVNARQCGQRTSGQGSLHNARRAAS